MLGLLARLWTHIDPIRRLQLVGLLCMMLATSVFELFSIGMVMPFLGILTTPEIVYENSLVLPLVKFFEIENAQALLFPTTVLFISAIILSATMRFLLVWVQTKLGMQILTELSVEAFRKTLYQPYPVHISRNSSDVVSGILNKISGGVGATISPLLVLISSTVFTAMIVGVLISLNPFLATVLFLGLGGLYGVIIWTSKRRLAEDSASISQAARELMQVLQEGLGGIRDILLDGTQEAYLSAFNDADVKLRKAQSSVQIIGSAPKFAIEALAIAILAVVAYVMAGTEGGIVGVIPILGAVVIGAQRLLPMLQSAFSSWALIRGAQDSLSDVLELLEQPVQSFVDKPGDAKDISFHREIRLSGVSFQHAEDTPMVLKNISLAIPRRGRIGIVGATGSGKSTLVDLIMGLLRSTEGSVLIDDTALEPSNTGAWHRRIAHVPQTIFLRDASIAENIAFGVAKDEIDFERVKSAARSAHISETIESWQRQYDTSVGERGVKLSGGQRQRIGIARAFYKQADVIIFDEATSALDTETEQAIMQSIDGFERELTIIMVAHRLTTLKNCTQLVELQNGRVHRIGSYAEICGEPSTAETRP